MKKLSGFAEIFTFFTPDPVVLVLADMAHYAKSPLIGCNVQACITSYSTKNLLNVRPSSAHQRRFAGRPMMTRL